MKIILNQTSKLDVIGIGYLLNGSATIMYHTSDTLAQIANQFGSVTSITAERPATVETFRGNGELIGINRIAGSDMTSVTISGLTKTVERRTE